MATSKSATITSASGETEFLELPCGRGFIYVTGTISAGAIVLIVRERDSAVDYVVDTIDSTVIATNSNEAGTGGSWGEPIQVSHEAQVKLAANAAFTGSVTARVSADQYQ